MSSSWTRTNRTGSSLQQYAGGCGIDLGACSGSISGPRRAAVVIDTAYGGGGTRDPSPVAVLSGPVVAVGGRRMGRAHIDHRVTGRCRHGGQAVVTLDIDNERGWFENARVMATPDDIMGSVATFTHRGRCRRHATRAGIATMDSLAMMQVPGDL
jgi:hypothetical protein